jgi:FecR protein
MSDDERLGPPPVEPMSDVAWSRIERALWSRMDGGETATNIERTRPASRRWLIVAAPLAAAAAFAAVVVGTRPSSPPDIVVSDEPARVVSGSAPSAVSFGDAHVDLDASTAVAMSHEGGQPIVLLERGAAWFTVAPRMQRPQFVVRAGDATVRVVGTRFRVARSEERIAVDVERGLVDVQFRGGVVKVAAGQRWVSESPATTLAIASTSPIAAIAAIASGAPGVPGPAVALSEPTRAPMPDLRSGSGPVRTPSGPARTPPKPAHVAESLPGPYAKSLPGPDAQSLPGPEAAHVTDADRLRAEYDRLAALEPKDPESALTGYLTLARGTSRWADLALFAAARLAADRHDRRAETLLGIYLQRFPGGANAADAEQLLARLKGARP